MAVVNQLGSQMARAKRVFCMLSPPEIVSLLRMISPHCSAYSSNVANAASLRNLTRLPSSSLTPFRAPAAS
eukprot:scaffold1814_cov148-Pinguiococcus_pyrenoidosus.AAC.2